MDGPLWKVQFLFFQMFNVTTLYNSLIPIPDIYFLIFLIKYTWVKEFAMLVSAKLKC